MTAKPRKPAEPFSAAFPDNLKESAQQIWLAGLGAFAKAQEQGGKVFEKLVKDGAELQRNTLPDAGQKISEATARMADMASAFSARATAAGPWDRLENLFEQRVARAMENLAAPSAAEFAALAARVAALEQAAPTRPAAAKPPRRPAAAKSAKAPPKPVPKPRASRKAS